MNCFLWNVTFVWGGKLSVGRSWKNTYRVQGLLRDQRAKLMVTVRVSHSSFRFLFGRGVCLSFNVCTVPFFYF